LGETALSFGSHEPTTTVEIVEILLAGLMSPAIGFTHMVSLAMEPSGSEALTFKSTETVLHAPGSRLVKLKVNNL